MIRVYLIEGVTLKSTIVLEVRLHSDFLLIYEYGWHTKPFSIHYGSNEFIKATYLGEL